MTSEPRAKNRAPSGAGSVRQRGTTWTAAWSFADPATGKRVQRSKGGFRLQKEAQAHISTQLAKIGDGSYRDRPDVRWTVADLLSAWLTERELRGVKPSTLARYRNTADAWILPKIGGLRLEALTAATVNQWLVNLGKVGSKRGGPLSPRSVQLAGTVLRMASKWAVQIGRLRVNAAADATMPKPAGTKMLVWGQADAAKFGAHVAKDRFAAMYLLGMTRGMRRGELCGLRWVDVDLTAGHLNVTHTRIVVGGKDVQVSTPKTDAGRRRVPLDAALVTILHAHAGRQLEERLTFGTGWTDTGYVFTREDGVPVTPDHVSSRFTRLCKAAGVPVIRLHDLRHGVASHMLQAGFSVRVVADVLGHADPAVTLRVYSHSLPGATDAAGEALSKAFGIVVDI